MTDVNIGIIVGSRRPGRHARPRSPWRCGTTPPPSRCFGQLENWVGALKPLRG
jgi:hypothetical protein